MKVIKAIYNFLVGDMIILDGILLVVLLLALNANVAALSPLRVISGPFSLLQYSACSPLPSYARQERTGRACSSRYIENKRVGWSPYLLFSKW